MNGVTDALLASQNACLEAEAHGLGICYLGTTLYNAGEIARILRLPKGVLPVMTVAMGYPETLPPLTDRLPLDAVVHRDTYTDYTPERLEILWREREAIGRSTRAASLRKPAGPNRPPASSTERRYVRRSKRDLLAQILRRTRRAGLFQPAVTSMKSMKASVLRCALAFACGVASYSCSVTRHLPPDSYMLTKNKIETDRTVPRDERITAGEIDRYVRQNPSKKLLGTNLPAWLYNQADPNKENGWNNLLRRLGSEPVILDTVQTAASNRNIKLYMDSRGFYESTSRYEIEYKRNRKAVVTYSVRQGAPYRINSLSYDYQDKFLEQVIRQDSAATLIRPGDIFDLTLLNDERQRITAYLKDRGYYKFSVNNISYIADTLAGDHLVDLTMVIRQQLEGYTPEGEPIYGNNAVYRLGKIFVYPDYDATAAATDPAYLRGMDTTYYRGLYIIRSGKPKIKPQTLRRAIPIYSDYLYSAGDKQRTSSNLQRLDYFKNASVTFSEPEPEDDNYITYIGEGGEGEAPVQTLERALDCDIFCTPAMRQGYTLDFEATTSSAFYALRPTVSYLNRNLFRGAELLNISLSGGYEFNTDETAAKNSYEVGLTASVTFPRFLAPSPLASRRETIYRPLTRIEVSTNLQRNRNTTAPSPEPTSAIRGTTAATPPIPSVR